jgi:hypothetical protein
MALCLVKHTDNFTFTFIFIINEYITFCFLTYIFVVFRIGKLENSDITEEYNFQ